jgi:hypothetical protein
VTCGGPDLDDLRYDNRAICGRSHLVADDPYRIYVYMPDGTRFVKVHADGASVTSSGPDGKVAVIELLAKRSRSVEWKIETDIA